MNLLEKHFANQTIRFLDHTEETTIFNEKNRALISFAVDDAIITAVGEKQVPQTVRLWVHHRTLVLGIPDSRLANLEAGIRYMKELGYQVIVRNSGGLAVLLDKDVLNVSFILGNKEALSIHEGYDLMYHFIQHLFKNASQRIVAYEIEGSYCPGDYDLSIDGKKFAGISQRRVRNGVSVQIYLDIGGSSRERATIVKNFYDIAKGKSNSKFSYPNVNPHVMASINELLKTNFTVNEIKQRMKELLQQVTNHVVEGELTHLEKLYFTERLRQMEKRNEKIMRLLNE